MKFDINHLEWIYPPKQSFLSAEKIVITTDPLTDCWQRTHYGFQKDNAHALVLPLKEDFCFTFKASFVYGAQYDQCGLMVYQDSDNWFKASIEYIDDSLQQLGSVVTANGYSDWAMQDIDTSVQAIYYRLSRSGADFCIEYSLDGIAFSQMRVFLFEKGAGVLRTGLYACSPSDHQFDATFSEFTLTKSQW